MNKQYLILLLVLLELNSILARDMPSHYHNTQSINQELEQIASRCGSFISLSDALSEPMIKQVNVNQGVGKRMRAYLLFGEHPRELISPESGLDFLNDLCSNPQSTMNQKILDNYELRMIINANPSSREKVENGAFCLRENENGVDLNRNYDAHWVQVTDDYKQVSSGPSAFSEPETKAIRDSMKNFNADLFLSVHSGTLGMYTPHAYSQEDGDYNENNMIDVLDRLKNNYCPSCDVGNAGTEVGYLSPGSCIDYAYDGLNIKYSFAFEIFHQDVDLKKDLEDSLDKEHLSFLQFQNQRKEKKIRKSKNHSHPSCFLQTSAGSGLKDDNCFNFFNPESQQDYQWYVKNWREAMGDMLNTVSDKEGGNVSEIYE